MTDQQHWMLQPVPQHPHIAPNFFEVDALRVDFTIDEAIAILIENRCDYDVLREENRIRFVYDGNAEILRDLEKDHLIEVLKIGDPVILRCN